jgi:hypothetical protein
MQSYLSTHSTPGWLPGSDGTFQFLPALRYVLGVDFLVLAEMFPRATGITNVSSLDEEQTLQVMRVIDAQKKAVVDSRFYSIHVVGADGFIIMKRASLNNRYFPLKHWLRGQRCLHGAHEDHGKNGRRMISQACREFYADGPYATRLAAAPRAPHGLAE